MPLPLDYENICLFLVHMAINGHAYSTINNEVSSLVIYGKMLRQDVDIRSDFGVKITLLALKRLLGEAPKSKEELYPRELLSLKPFVSFDEFVQESVWLGILILYRSMLRKSHLFMGEFNQNLLQRCNVLFVDWGLVLTVKHTKTIQFGERVLKIPICRDGGPLCVVELLRNYIRKYPVPMDYPILSRIVNGSVQNVKYSPALQLLKKWSKKAGLDKNIGMHSLRRGAATLMALAGMPLEDIKNRGDWQSTAVLKYLAYPMVQKIAIEKKIGVFINQIL